MGPSSGQPAQKGRVWIPHNVHHRPAPTPRPSYVAPRLPPPPRQLNIQDGQSNVVAPLHNDGLCHKCGQPGHRAHNYRQDRPKRAPRSTVGRMKGRRNHHISSCSAEPPAMSGGQVTHVKIEEARESQKNCDRYPSR